MTCEPDDGLRSVVRGSRNFDPRTSNIVSRFSRPSRLSRLSQWPTTAEEKFMNNAG